MADRGLVWRNVAGWRREVTLSFLIRAGHLTVRANLVDDLSKTLISWLSIVQTGLKGAQSTPEEAG